MAETADWLVEEIVGGLLADREAVEHLLEVTADELDEDLAYAEQQSAGVLGRRWHPEVDVPIADAMRVAWRRLRAVPAGEDGPGG